MSENPDRFTKEATSSHKSKQRGMAVEEMELGKGGGASD
jgi:hypothetical protein